MTRAAHTESDRIAMVSAAPMEERTRMLASLKAAEARIEGGQYLEHDATTFVDRLMKLRAATTRDKTA